MLTTSMFQAIVAHNTCTSNFDLKSLKFKRIIFISSKDASNIVLCMRSLLWKVCKFINKVKGCITEEQSDSDIDTPSDD